MTYSPAHLLDLRGLFNIHLQIIGHLHQQLLSCTTMSLSSHLTKPHWTAQGGRLCNRVTRDRGMTRGVSQICVDC